MNSRRSTEGGVSLAKAGRGHDSSTRRQFPLTVGDDWRVFAPLKLLPSLRGAIAVFPVMGYHGATVRDLAQAGGVTVPTLYYHHGDKQTILFDLLDLGVRELLDRLELALRSIGGDPGSEFDRVVEVGVLHVIHRREVATLDSEIRFLEPGNHAAYQAMRRQFEDRLLRSIERGVIEKAFDVDDPPGACRAILGMIQAVSTWYSSDGSLTPHEVARRHVAIGRRILGSEP